MDDIRAAHQTITFCASVHITKMASLNDAFGISPRTPEPPFSMQHTDGPRPLLPTYGPRQSSTSLTCAIHCRDPVKPSHRCPNSLERPFSPTCNTFTRLGAQCTSFRPPYKREALFQSGANAPESAYSYATLLTTHLPSPLSYQHKRDSSAHNFTAYLTTTLTQ